VGKHTKEHLDTVLARLDEVLKQAQELRAELREQMAKRAEADRRAADEIRDRKTRAKRG
jgi:hypothetical protein